MTNPEKDHKQRRDLRDAVRQAAAAQRPPDGPSRVGITSQLSVDESLMLQSIGWEPVELVCGVSTYSIPDGFWQWSSGEITPATLAYQRAFDHAAAHLRAECQQAGGHGVVGVHIDISVERHYVNAVLVGTAVSPIDAPELADDPFISDLSGRDFALLHNAGWEPIGLAAGAAFLYAPRRSPAATLQQATQNAELANYTEALYTARTSAMNQVREAAAELDAAGVVAVQLSEGPMSFAAHAIRFTAWGTAVRRSKDPGEHQEPRIVVSLDDSHPTFQARALRRGRG